LIALEPRRAPARIAPGGGAGTGSNREKNFNRDSGIFRGGKRGGPIFIGRWMEVEMFGDGRGQVLQRKKGPIEHSSRFLEKFGRPRRLEPPR
jgi:hypothetical protein